MAELDTSALADAAGSFEGPLLEGLDLTDAPDFHGWCVAERERFRALELRVLGWRRRGQPEAVEARAAMFTLARLGWGRPHAAFRQLFTSLFCPEADLEQMQAFNEMQRESASPEDAVRLGYAFGDIDVAGLLPCVRVPALVLHARDDAVVPFDQGRRLAAAIPGARFVPLDGRNHILLETEPAWTTFLDEVRAFLSATAAGVSRSPSPAPRWPR